ncbi:MAG: adenylate/guanylate cyclase domain-containing protein [Smithellaceae bacterium]|nr:adenylate/guanylate cyclase domain-containing protein [Smithellaceae bacterium]
MSRLLVVDDEEGVRRSLRKVLEPEGYLVILAEDGQQAIRIVREEGEEIETVISDYRMPGLNGLETLVAIGRLNPEITRIILTGYATMDSAIEAVNAGIDGFITKPFENFSLRSRVRECNVNKRLKQFVPEQIMGILQRDGGRMAPKRQNASVLFSDIRGFTALAEELEPEELVRMLNGSYFSPLDNIIATHNGTLDKHIGDSIMGVFGAPVASGDHAQRALLCAVEMIDEMIRINDNLSPPGREIAVGIGISSGEVMAGVYGSARKKEYTVFGPPVNRAARMEKHAAKWQILMCEETYRGISDERLLARAEPLTIESDGKRLTAYGINRSRGPGGR